MKKFFIIALLLGLISFLGFNQYTRYQDRKERQFYISVSDQWNSLSCKKKYDPPSPETLIFLNQPFFFLGSGKQTHVFESSNGYCVLKLFKNAEKEKKKKKLRESLLGAYLAKTIAPEETGILLCALHGVQEKKDPLLILTKKGRAETVNLRKTPFLLQRKAHPFKQALLRLKAQGNIEEANSRIHAIFSLLSQLREKELVDRDGALVRNGNIGFIGNKAILMDTGKLCILKDKKKITLHDINRLRPLVSWCKKAFPELLPTLDECIKNYQA